jgi:Tol biopolymer transport system component
VAGTTTVVAELAPYQANRWYEASSISDDGRYVAYNRSPDPWHAGLGDVLTWDAVTNTSIHIAEGAIEYRPLQRISADGRTIVFRPQPSDDNRGIHADFYVWDRVGS